LLDLQSEPDTIAAVEVAGAAGGEEVGQVRAEPAVVSELVVVVAGLILAVSEVAMVAVPG